MGAGFDFEQLTVGASAVQFTQATWSPTGAIVATKAVCTVNSGTIRIRYDGTDPTATTGHVYTAGQTFAVSGGGNLQRFRAISDDGVSAELAVTFERGRDTD